MKIQYELLDWDSRHFGFKVASIGKRMIGSEQLRDLLESMRVEGIRLAYWATDLKTKNACRKSLLNTGKLVDKKVFFVKDISIGTVKYTKKNLIKTYKSGTVCQELNDLSIQSGIYSRFNIDENISQSAFENLYKKWIQKSVANDDVEVHVALKDNKIIGMITLFIEKECGKIGLFSVDQNSRGLGIGKDLLFTALIRFKSLNCKTAEVITQQDNVPACSLYKMFGFRIKQVDYFHHIWL